MRGSKFDSTPAISAKSTLPRRMPSVMSRSLPSCELGNTCTFTAPLVFCCTSSANFIDPACQLSFGSEAATWPSLSVSAEAAVAPNSRIEDSRTDRAVRRDVMHGCLHLLGVTKRCRVAQRMSRTAAKKSGAPPWPPFNAISRPSIAGSVEWARHSGTPGAIGAIAVSASMPRREAAWLEVSPPEITTRRRPVCRTRAFEDVAQRGAEPVVDARDRNAAGMDRCAEGGHARVVGTGGREDQRIATALHRCECGRGCARDFRRQLALIHGQRRIERRSVRSHGSMRWRICAP